MATNEDFDGLIERIDTATNLLEVSVGVINENITSIEQAVITTEANANTAIGAAQQAQAASVSATQSANSALESKNEAQELVDTFSQSHVIGEAPINDNEYVRKNGAWVVNSGGSGGGGDVVSVNGKTPNEQGNVSLVYADIPDTPTLSNVATSGDYQDLSNKPVIPSQGIVSVQAGANVTVDNTDPLNPVISATGGGGGGGGFPIEAGDWEYDGVPLGTSYPFANPNQPLQADKLAIMHGTTKPVKRTLQEIVNNGLELAIYLRQLPACNIAFGDMTLGSSNSRQGIMKLYFVQIGANLYPGLIAIDNATAKTYSWQDGTRKFIPAAGA